MAKKRKRSSDAPAPAAVEKPDDSAPERPARTLFGFKDKPDSAAVEPASKDGAAAAATFRNREKVLITCSRRIIYR
jgi:ribosome biogenesis protein BRX1